jgi:hypothetical protein
LLSAAALLLLLPNLNIEPDYTETEYFTETFTQFKQKEDLQKIRLQTRKAMYLAITKYKEKKRIKKRQTLTLLAKGERNGKK